MSKIGIKGLTDDKVLAKTRALPRIGKLRKGGEKRQKKRKDGSAYEIMGVDLEYFRLDLEEEFAHLEADFIDLYGKEPLEFPHVEFFADDIDDAFMTAYEAWDGAGTLLHRCDGNDQHLWYDKKRGDWNSAKIPCRSACLNTRKGTGDEDEQRSACQRTGRLKVMLIDFTYATGVYGYFEIETHSKHDIINLYSGLNFLYSQFGTLVGIPFVLGRAKRQVSIPMSKDNNGNVKRGKTTKSLMYIRPTEDFVKTILLTAPAPQRVQRLTAGEAAKALGSGSTRRVGADNPHDTVIGATVADDWHTDEAIVLEDESMTIHQNTENPNAADDGQDQFTDDITHIETRLTKKGQRYYVLNGLTLWTRQPIRDLFSDTDVSAYDVVLEEVGTHTLPDPLRAAYRTVVYVGDMGERALRGELLRLHRIRNGQTVDVKARTANEGDSVSEDTIDGAPMHQAVIEAAWDRLSSEQQDDITEEIFWDAAHDVLTVDSALTPELLADAVRVALA